MKKANLVLLLLLGAAQLSGIQAQTNYFTYDDESKTIINGTTDEAIKQIRDEGEMTIPSNIVKVTRCAFYQIKVCGVILQQLIIEGDTEFEQENGTNALSDVNYCLSTIEIKGNAMTTDHLRSLLQGCNNTGNLKRIDILNTEFPLDGSFSLDNASGVKVMLPAARVGTQTFGSAGVYGRFTLTKEVGTICTNATFYDVDDGSNFLFYIATDVDQNNQLHMQRVRYVKAGEGIVMHNASSTNNTVYLPRVSAESETSETADIYSQNMLKGVTTATDISATDGDKTNFVLKDGVFHPVSGGTVPANRAYLQVLTTTWDAIKGTTARMSMHFDEEETGIIDQLTTSASHHSPEWYTLDGLRLKNRPSAKGIYIVNRKKIKI